jgi:hypothetical protein
MSRLTPPLLALALALAFSAPLQAQQVVTSKGVRTLVRTDGFKDIAQFQQAQRLAEDVALEVLQDVAANEGARGSAAGQATGIADRAKRANADYAAAKAAFDLRDQQYRSDLASYEQRQAALGSDIERQRQQAAVLEALPSAQRDYAEVARLNDWATQLANTRTQLEAERNRLLASHDQVEAERSKLAQQRVDAENKLKGERDTSAVQFEQAQAKVKAAYGNLRVVVNYLTQTREQQRQLTGSPAARSEVLEKANAKLRVYESGQSGR